MLSRGRILDLFSELGDELCRMGTRGDVFIVGGTAMTVAYDARPATRDVDAIWHPSSEVCEAAARVAERHPDLPRDWLNDSVKRFLPGDDPGPPRVVFEGDCLTVSAASPEYMLATKLLASRASRDEADISPSTTSVASPPWNKDSLCSNGSMARDPSRPRSASSSKNSLPADRLIETARHASIELLTGYHHGVNHGPEAGCKILSRLTTVTALPRAVEVDGLGDLRLRVRFSDGLVRELDFDGVLEPLNDPTMFARARVDHAAGTVRWPNGVDLDPAVLHGDREPADGSAPTVLAEYHLRDAG